MGRREEEQKETLAEYTRKVVRRALVEEHRSSGGSFSILEWTKVKPGTKKLYLNLRPNAPFGLVGWRLLLLLLLLLGQRVSACCPTSGTSSSEEEVLYALPEGSK